MLTTDEIYAAFYNDSTIKGFLHSHSYTGNPLACSAALATLAIFETDDVINNNQQKTAAINEKMQVLTDLPIQHMRNKGMIWAFDVVTENAGFATTCYQQALQHGLLLRPIGKTVYFMPPYIINETEMDFMINTTKLCIEQSYA